MLFLMTVLACSGSKDSAEEEVAAPKVTWLSPKEGDTVTAGDVDAALIVDHFSLREPGKHNDGSPIGFVSVGVDGTEVSQTGLTNFTLSLTAGSHTLSAQLFYSDGDEVIATTDLLCDEDSADAACVPVVSSVTVTVQ